MSINLIFQWLIFLLIGTLSLGLIGLAIDIISLVRQKRRIKFLLMLTNYLDIVFEVIVRLLSIPIALVIISWVDVLVPGGSMQKVEGFFSFIIKLGIIISIIIYTIKLKIPQIAKPNEMERVATRGAVLLGSLLGTGYFCYSNLIELKSYLSYYVKMFGIF